MSETTFENKVSILADLWILDRDNEDLIDFIEYNDIGLPLAYAFANDIAIPTAIGENFVNETFAVLLAGLDTEDTGFETYQDLMFSKE